MPMVRLSFTPSPAHVRTARLVGVAVARRAGVAESLLDEVRQAIGEACSRAVALHRRYKLTEPVVVEMTDSPGYTVRVVDRAPAVAAARELSAETARELAGVGLSPDGLSEEALAAGISLALLTGLVDELRVLPAPDGEGTEVRMHWPVRLVR